MVQGAETMGLQWMFGVILLFAEIWINHLDTEAAIAFSQEAHCMNKYE